METQPETQGQNVESKLKQVLTNALRGVGEEIWQLWLNNIWGPNYRPNKEDGISAIMPKILKAANTNLKAVTSRDAVSQAASEIFGILDKPKQQ